MLKLRHGQHGVTLIELLVSVALVGILFALAMPNYRTWIQNQQIRAGAESILNGIQLARSAAVNNNGPARFVLCNLPTTSWEVRATSAIAAANAVASPVCGTTVPAGETREQEHSSLDGSKAATVTVTPAAATMLYFNSFGRVVASGVPITQVDVTTAVSGVRPLRVTVSSGGGTRMCDPALTTGTDPRAC